MEYLVSMASGGELIRIVSRWKGEESVELLRFDGQHRLRIQTQAPQRNKKCTIDIFFRFTRSNYSLSEMDVRVSNSGRH